MCHSVEMYLPKVTRDVAEHALRAEARSAARERALAAALLSGASRLLAQAHPVTSALARHVARTPALAALALLAACAASEAPAPEPYVRVPAEVANNDTNVYAFEHLGPNRVGTLAVTAWATAGPNAAPAGTLAGEAGRAKAEAAAAFYGQNELCDGAPFLMAGEGTSRYDASRNAWTVFGRCTAGA